MFSLVVRRLPRTRRAVGDRLHYDGPNRPEVQRRLRPARLGLGLALSPGLGLGLGLALASLEGTSCRPSKCLGIGLGGFTPLILFLISTSRLGLEMFRDRIRGVYPPHSISNLNKHNNELHAVRRRPRTNSYHPSETKNYLISSVGDQGIFVLACHAQKVRVTTALRPEHPG